MIHENQALRPAIPNDAGMLSGTAAERAESIAARCGSGRQRHGNWIVCCPAHDDQRPSLTITPTSDKVLVHCFAGCDAPAILAAIGLSMCDLYADDLPPLSSPKKRQTRQRIPEPPGPATEDSIALHWLVQFLVDDITILEIEAARACLRQAAAHPLQVLWLQQQLHRHGLAFDLVRKVLDPGSEPISPQSSTPIPTLATRLPAHVSPTLRTAL